MRQPQTAEQLKLSVRKLNKTWKQRLAERLCKYRMTKKLYDMILKEQRGVCGICGDVQEQDLGIDHDHSTGNVRGLLCSNCNTGLGMIGDTRESVLAALAYLDRYERRIKRCAAESSSRTCRSI